MEPKNSQTSYENAIFTPDNVMEALAKMSEQMKSMQNTIGEQDKRIQVQAQTILDLQRDLRELREKTADTEMGLSERISAFARNTNESLDNQEKSILTLKDGLLAESMSNSDFEQEAGVFYDKVGEFNEELLNRVQKLEKHLGIATEEHGKEASDKVFVSPKFSSHPVSLGEHSRPGVENKFLKMLSDAEKEKKASTPAVVVHTSAKAEGYKRVRRGTNESSPLSSSVCKAILNEAIDSDSDTF
jgi:hypothetical protein